MNLERKLTVLTKIANVFNNNNITWAVGASLLLYLKGAVDNFRDIDIVVAEEDVSAVKELLSNYGVLQPPNPNAQYKTRTFLEYVIDGIDVDIMAGLVILDGTDEHYFPLKKENITDVIKLNDTAIPLQSLEEWKHYYSLMGRPEKVKLIERTLDKIQ